MNDVLVTAPAAATPARPRIRTWHLFAVMVAASLVMAWVNKELVMTREVYHALLGTELEGDRIDRQFDMVQQTAKWGYVAIPAVVWLRIALVAMLAQLFLLLAAVEVPIRQVFRAACWAYPALLYGAAVRMFLLARAEPSSLTRESLSFVPGSLTAFFPTLAEPGTATHLLLTQVSLWEGLWCVLLYFALRRVAPRLGAGGALMTVAAVWTLIAAFLWGITLYVLGVQ